ncbi:diaminopimelate decarboxylase [Desulfoluna spongiiphila]|uniref:Diaminopimelate decarboxylase n=1 Tax=Desulfoluna spongiiphila TaxID=419481 RepID=A0A1G5CI95_9BACT|nr:diaminopimelate decarboxylase [Desulfoluna spongiiphila]SCY02229.1 diaminopimelate decarboxylase [Desulfoluna spongiiphila]
MPDSEHAPFWWERDRLRYDKGHLRFAGEKVQSLARRFGTPTFLYSADRIRDNLASIREALETTGRPYRLHYAMKANRFAPILTLMAGESLCGIDACSPEEVMHAMGCGFKESDISYTATAVSNSDLDTLARFKNLHLNCDAVSTLRRLGPRAKGRDIGLRINPAMGVGYGDNELLHYSGEATTKFGIYKEQFDEALDTAARHKLAVTTLHLHTGCGYLNDQLPVWEQILAEAKTFAEKIPGLRAINLGGGLGVPHTKDDTPLDLKAWAAVIKRVFGKSGLTIEVEPGDYVVKDAGLLLLTANTVETRRSTRYIGVDGGFNIAVEPAFYSLPFEPVVTRLRKGPDLPVTVAGNINEALDVFAEGLPLPPVEEEDTLALINAGAYASAMSSNHCMRGQFREVLLF